MTCDHGYIGACAECDGSGQIPPPELVHPIGCECEDCAAAYELDRRDPRDAERPEPGYHRSTRSDLTRGAQ